MVGLVLHVWLALTLTFVSLSVSRADDLCPQCPAGWDLAYLLSLTEKRLLVWGGDQGLGKDLAKVAHLQCAMVFLVGSDARVAQAATQELLSFVPPTGTCSPGVKPLVGWAVGDINNASFALELTDRYSTVLGGPPDIVWNYIYS